MSKESAAKGDIQKQADEATEKGYFGTKVDPVDNAEYTLTTGPTSPTTTGSTQINIADLSDRKDG